MRHIERAVVTVAALLSLLSIASPIGAQEIGKASAVSTPRDDWFAVTIADQPCGWMHEQVVVEPNRILTTNEMRLTIGRAGSAATMSVQWRFEESADGTPIQCLVEQVSGGERSQSIYRFLPEGIHVEERAGERTLTRVIERPAGPWMTPAQVERLAMQARASDATTFEYVTIDPSGGLRIVEMKSVRTALHADKSAQWETRNNLIAAVTIDDVDALGHVTTSRTKLPIGDMVSRRSTERRAKSIASGAGVDVIARSMIELATPNAKLQSGESTRLAVRSIDGTPLALPSVGSQRVQSNPAGGDFVDILVGATSPVTPEEAADPRFLASTILIDCVDPLVRELSGTALQVAHFAHNAPTSTRAEALRSFVHRFISKKDLATAFAGASAVARSQSGDCSEHAILLAALLRAQGIPSRIASGLVYADEFGGKRGVFAWHMWTQAAIDGAWLDLDATLQSRPFHPGHLLIATSAQDDAQVDADFAGLLSTIGNLHIEVVRVD
ncbi:MAG: transglutaminase domain-containing protein [Phycisphaerales bacterium]|nr:transglutaminase domain-containing protein [Phycisphaerales bacterium]